MGRLIDADALEKDMTIKAAMDKDRTLRTWSKAIGSIHDAPTVDAVPVVHGRWIEQKIIEDHGMEWQSARCSECGLYHTTPYLYYFDNFNYCPSCGTKMEVEHGNQS